MAPQRKLRHDDYQVCWICPLDIERTAAEAMLDERHESLPNSRECQATRRERYGLLHTLSKCTEIAAREFPSGRKAATFTEFIASTIEYEKIKRSEEVRADMLTYIRSEIAQKTKKHQITDQLATLQDIQDTLLE